MTLSLFASDCVQRVVTISSDVRTRVSVCQPRGDSAMMSATAEIAQTSWIVVSIISTPLIENSVPGSLKFSKIHEL